MESHLPGSHVAWLLELSQDLRKVLGLVGTLPPSYLCDPQGSYIISTFQVENQDSNVFSKAGKSGKDSRLMSRASQQEIARQFPVQGHLYRRHFNTQAVCLPCDLMPQGHGTPTRCQGPVIATAIRKTKGFKVIWLLESALPWERGSGT